MADTADEVEQWRAAQARVIALVEAMPAGRAEQRVPACPGWTVRELLSHMIGLDADVLAGDEPDDHNERWTQAQVDARAGHDVAALLAEWRALTEPLAAWMAGHGTRPVNDVVIHEQDLRGALDAPGATDTPALAAIRERMAGRVDAAVRDADLPALALVGRTWTFVAGDGDPAVELRAGDFDLARAVLARRSAAQLRAWTTHGDVDPYLPCFATLGPLPEHDLAV